MRSLKQLSIKKRRNPLKQQRMKRNKKRRSDYCLRKFKPCMEMSLSLTRCAVSCLTHWAAVLRFASYWSLLSRSTESSPRLLSLLVFLLKKKTPSSTCRYQELKVRYYQPFHSSLQSRPLQLTLAYFVLCWYFGWNFVNWSLMRNSLLDSIEELVWNCR